MIKPTATYPSLERDLRSLSSANSVDRREAGRRSLGEFISIHSNAPYYAQSTVCSGQEYQVVDEVSGECIQAVPQAIYNTITARGAFLVDLPEKVPGSQNVSQLPVAFSPKVLESPAIDAPSL